MLNNVQVVRVDSTKSCDVNKFCVKNTLKKFGPFDVIIDDGCHTTECILSTFANTKSLLRNHSNSMYFVEDNFASSKAFQYAAKGILKWVDGYSHDGVGGVYLFQPPSS